MAVPETAEAVSKGASFGVAVLLTGAAGLATVLGSVFVLFLKRPGPKFMAVALGFAAGVMIHVSFVELLATGQKEIGFSWAHIAFFVGMLGMFVIDSLVPHSYLGEEHDTVSPSHTGKDPKSKALLRTGLLAALGLGIHNFPEGMATFAAALGDAKVGGAIAVAIAIHNIPEGLAVAAPVYAATGSRAKALWWSFLSGLAEPVGAALAGLILLPFLTPTVLAWMLCIVGGLMVYVSMDELLPASREYGHEHLSIIGAFAGMVVMALSLALMGV